MSQSQTENQTTALSRKMSEELQNRNAVSDAAGRSSVFDHPIGFWFFFWGELAERCSYYGMRAILLLYMIQILEFTDGSANRIMAYYMAACYLTPLLGGYLADNFLGKYRTIVYFAIPYVCGQTLLGIASLHNPTCLFLSLGLLAMGSGVIKPNISTLMGQTYDQRKPGKTKLRSDAFAMFYGSINIGAALSSFCVPWIRNYYGGNSHAYAIAFLFPAGLMVLSFLVFALGKPFYAVETIQRVRLTPEQRHERWVVFRRVLGLFSVVTIFWALFDQSSTTWILFARDHLKLELFGIPLSPDQIQTLNPVLIIILLPPITMLWHLLSGVGLNLRPTTKMLFGFVLTTITMAVVALAAFRGAAVATAGGPAALAGAKKVAAAIEAPANHSTYARVVQEVILAVTAARDADEGKGDAVAAKHKMKAARKAIQSAGPIDVALAAARQSATSSVHAAEIAALIARDVNAATAAPALQEETKKVTESAKTANIAARATKVIVDSVLAPLEGEPTSTDENAQAVLADCSAVANHAAGAATAAVRSAEAAAAGNARSAQVNAAVSGVDSADAAITAARAMAKQSGASVPAIVAEAETAASAARISLLWQIIPFILITMAEICISVVGLELAFAAAPPAMKSFVTGLWLFTVFFANFFINAQITPLYNETFWGISLTPDWYFLACALLMIPVTLLFMVVSRRFNRPVE